MRDNQPIEQLKIELLSQWKLEAESRNLLIQVNLVKIVILVNMGILMVLVNSGDSCKLGDSDNSQESDYF